MLHNFLHWIGRHSWRFRRWAYKHNFKWAWWGVLDYISNGPKPEVVGDGTLTLKKINELWDMVTEQNK